MAISGDVGNYIRAIKSKGVQNIEPAYSERKKAFLKQGKRCAKCKKDLNPNYCKYERDPKTKEMIAICSGCAIQGAKKY
ncbi:MAG: hypothetical protein KC516_04300 [Nanoarchaeota archaeon]|nr:hypothetical protein [Nanoarchaeota archaeon]